MPKALGEIKRIARLHGEDCQDRCSTADCAEAQAEAEQWMPDDMERLRRCEAKALLLLIAERGLDPADYFHDVDAAFAATADIAESELDEGHRIAARVRIKLAFPKTGALY